MFDVTLNIYFYFLTFRNTNITSIRPTKMFLSHAYDLYYNKLFRGISQAFIPFLLMAFLNGRIIFKMSEYKRITSTRVIFNKFFKCILSFSIDNKLIVDFTM